MKKLSVLLLFIFIVTSVSIQAEDQIIIYDKAGNAVVTPDKRKDYRFFAPVTEKGNKEQEKNHYEMDIEPWLVWGYSPEDTSTVEERLRALISTKEGKEGFEKYINGKGSLYDEYIKSK